MAIPAEKLCDRIDEHLDELACIDELSNARYHAAHERFENASNQRALILDWLESFAGSMSFPVDRPTRLLSAGCGGGVMDLRISSIFSGHCSALSLVGVDPNPEHTRAFKMQLAGRGFEVEAFTGPFEQFTTAQRFDVIGFIHCLYYFEHIGPELGKAVEMLAPGGALIILQAPNAALNHLADRVWKKQFDRSAWYSDDVRRTLSTMNVGFRVERIDAEVDVTECFDPDSGAGVEILDFIVQTDTRKLSQAFQASLRRSLHAICRQQGGRLVCEHPVDAIVVTGGTSGP